MIIKIYYLLFFCLRYWSSLSGVWRYSIVCLGHLDIFSDILSRRYVLNLFFFIFYQFILKYFYYISDYFIDTRIRNRSIELRTEFISFKIAVRTAKRKNCRIRKSSERPGNVTRSSRTVSILCTQVTFKFVAV